MEPDDPERARGQAHALKAQIALRAAQGITELDGPSGELAEGEAAETETGKDKDTPSSLLDRAPVMVAFLGPDSRVKLVNREWERTLGWSLEELREPGFDVIAELYPDPSERQRLLDFVAASTGEWADFRATTRDGSVIDTSWANVHLPDGTIVSIGADVSERKRSEEELRLHASVLDQLRAAVVTTDMRGVVTYWNQQAATLYGLSRGDAIGRNIADLIVEASAQEVGTETFQHIVAHGSWEGEFTVRRRDGSLLPVYAIDTLIINRRGKPVGVTAVSIDITERKRMLDAERQQRLLAEALRDTAVSIASTLDREEVLDRVLEDAALIARYDAAVILLIQDGRLRIARHRGFAERGLGEWPEAFVTDEQHHPSFRESAETGKPVVVPDIGVYPYWATPELSWVRSYVSAPISMGGEVIGLLSLQSASPGSFTALQAHGLGALAHQAAVALQNACLFNEVRAGHKRQEVLSRQLLEAQESERRAVARELHDEIGQVLTAVAAHLHVLELTHSRATRIERLRDGLSLVDNALRQVRDLALDLRPSLLDDFGLVSALDWYSQREAERSGLVIEFEHGEVQGRLSPMLETTCFRIVQIALTNVVRHAQAKHVLIDLRRSEAALELVIGDDGIGFDVQSALESGARGASLGLLSMAERVRLAQGTLQIDSAPGAGTEIEARFPTN